VDGIATDNPMFQDQMSVLANRLAVAGLSTYEAHRQAYARFYMMVQDQARALAYVDTFWLLALVAAIMFGLSFALKKNDPRAAGHVAAE
jgi:hypothetical protein